MTHPGYHQDEQIDPDKLPDPTQGPGRDSADDVTDVDEHQTPLENASGRDSADDVIIDREEHPDSKKPPEEKRPPKPTDFPG